MHYNHSIKKNDLWFSKKYTFVSGYNESHKWERRTNHISPRWQQWFCLSRWPVTKSSLTFLCFLKGHFASFLWVKHGIFLHSPHPYIIINLVNVSLDSEDSLCARDTQLLFALFSNVSVSISLTPSTTINRWYLNWPLK